MRKYEEEMMMETKAQNKKGPAPWKERLWNEDGTALFMAVVAALLLLVFALSFSSLSNLEARIGINDYRARQAQMVAEAGFEAVRNHLRPVLTDYTNFLGNTYTCDPNAGPCTCTTGANGTANGVPCTTTGIFAVSAGNFTIRVDNDFEDPGRVPVPETDTNGEVMLTALGRTGLGNGRAQARVQVILDDPFKHVCSSDDVTSQCATYTGDDPCTQAGIYVQPCQTEDPHGPKVFAGLPSPTTIQITDAGRLGCIPIWAAQWLLEGNAGPVRVIGNANPAQSYFDMALSIDALAIYNADVPQWIPNAPAGRNLRAYCPVPGVGGCVAGVPALGNANPSPNTLGCGLVLDVPIWTTPGGGTIKYINKLANAAGETTLGSGVVVYVAGIVNTGNNTHVQGTVVLHGNNVPGTGAGASDVLLSPRFCANRLSAGIQCGGVNTTLFNAGSDGAGNLNAPGYPFALIIHHPGIGAGGDPPPPQQTTVAQLSSTGVEISGIIFSTGNVEFNPIQVDGGVVAYGVDIQGNTQFVYNNAYGSAAKKGVSIPPGAYSAQFMRSTWLHCRATDANNVFTSPDIPATCN